ncbi:MAG: hypothetical protein HOJ48_01235 [Desulfobacula sp.]|nr:hypothetical protein [Desulfobacula sp.]MBT6337898.1 hypothetical protein [Desulfobacula sp.]
MIKKDTYFMAKIAFAYPDIAYPDSAGRAIRIRVTKNPIPYPGLSGFVIRIKNGHFCLSGRVLIRTGHPDKETI